jgi:hypothetical protein
MQRRNKVMRLHVRGLTQTDIAARLGVSQATVCHDIRAVSKEWQESRVSDLNAAKMTELARLEWVIRQAMNAYLRSCQAGPDEDGNPQPPQPGDTRYLAEVRDAVQLRCKIWGLIGPDGARVQVLAQQNNIPWAEVLKVARADAAAGFDPIEAEILAITGGAGDTATEPRPLPYGLKELDLDTMSEEQLRAERDRLLTQTKGNGHQQGGTDGRSGD